MAKLIKVNEASRSCRITINAYDLVQVGFKEGDEIKVTVKGKKLILSKEG